MSLSASRASESVLVKEAVIADYLVDDRRCGKNLDGGVIGNVLTAWLIGYSWSQNDLPTGNTVSEDLSEVRDFVLSDASFILGTWSNQKVVSMLEAVEAARESSSTHVQMVAEQNFDRLPGCASLKYFRGCSGFDGFSKGLFTVKDLEDFSRSMFSLIGDKWSEWGSEQTMSNVLVSNAPKMGLLPYPAYYNYWGTEESEQKFIHFVGTYRYDDGVYLRAVRAALAELRGGHPLQAAQRLLT